MEEEFTEKQVMLFIKNKGTVKLSEIMAEFNKSKYLTRSIISKPLILNILKEERIKGDSIIKYIGVYKPVEDKKGVNDSVTINPLENSKNVYGVPPKSENVDYELANISDISTIDKNVVDTSRMLGELKPSKFIHVAGLGDISPELLDQLFSENIITIDVEKLIKKMNTSTLKIHNDKISFDLAVK